MERWREYFEEQTYTGDVTGQRGEEENARDEHEIDTIDEEVKITSHLK